MEIINEENPPITLCADVLDMGLVHLLESEYTVIIQRHENKIKIELYDK